jgi:hypothetical protein
MALRSARVAAVALAFAVLVAALVPAVATAGSISISIMPLVELRDGALSANVQVKNSGDEAAQAVTPVLRFRDKEARAQARDQLPPNQAMRADLSIPAADLGTGRWPYRVAVDYADANQYPFQALHVGQVSVGSPPPAKVAFAAVTADPLAGSGTLRVRVKNLAGTPHDVALGVVVPEGVEVTDAGKSVALAAWEEKSVSVGLVNRTALAGSRYPIFVTAEYDDGDVHQAAIGQGMLEVTNARTFFQSQRELLWIGAALLVAAWIGILSWQLATGRLRRAVPPGR